MISGATFDIDILSKQTQDNGCDNYISWRRN